MSYKRRTCIYITIFTFEKYVPILCSQTLLIVTCTTKTDDSSFKWNCRKYLQKIRNFAKKRNLRSTDYCPSVVLSKFSLLLLSFNKMEEYCKRKNWKLNPGTLAFQNHYAIQIQVSGQFRNFLFKCYITLHSQARQHGAILCLRGKLLLLVFIVCSVMFSILIRQMRSKVLFLIKNVLKRRKKSDTYLATVCRHRWSRQITMKIDNILQVFLFS